MFYPIIVANAFEALNFDKTVEFCPNCGTKIFVDPYDPFNVGYVPDGRGGTVNTIYCQACDFAVLTENAEAHQEFIEEV